jgi:hypothetical protein
VRSAPGTYAWLAILLVTTIIIHQFSPGYRYRFILHRSTNLHELSHSPIRVLISSAMWIDGDWLPYLFLYSIFHAPAERWLGTLRWLCVVLFSHVGATYLSQSVVYYNIRHGFAPPSAARIPDIGVSYALAGVEGVLTYLIAAPWRFLYLAGVLAYYATPLIYDRTFTGVGHLSALLLGLSCYVLTHARDGRWDPAVTARSALARVRRG